MARSTTKSKATCSICSTEVSSLRKSPEGHTRPHSEEERACLDCWENWLSYKVEQEHRHVPCLFACGSHLTEKELKSLAKQSTIVRYDKKVKKVKIGNGYVCMARCGADSQDFDRETDGRVSTCKDCKHQVCMDCDRPEHIGETCGEYQSRVVSASAHAKAEEASSAVVRSCSTCPECEAWISVRGCGYVQCFCGYRFCSRCRINWVGENSAYLGGKQAHAPLCLYHSRDEPSEHMTSNRFTEAEDVQARLDAKNLPKGKPAKKRKATQVGLKPAIKPRAKRTKK